LRPRSARRDRDWSGPNRPPEKPDYEIDATGHYVLPGFVDVHVHAGSKPKNADAEYATSSGWRGVRRCAAWGSDHDFVVRKERSGNGY
jgi:predicted amidohydrolase YtcJ